jgi:hypothetical protein
MFKLPGLGASDWLLNVENPELVLFFIVSRPEICEIFLRGIPNERSGTFIMRIEFIQYLSNVN